MASFEDDHDDDARLDRHDLDEYHGHLTSSASSRQSSLKPTGLGYSIKCPEERKRATLMRGQANADKIPSPRDIKRTLASAKIVATLGGNKEEIPQNAEDLREKRMNHLHQQKRKKLKQRSARKSAHHLIRAEEFQTGHFAKLSIATPSSSNPQPVNETPQKTNEFACSNSKRECNENIHETKHIHAFSKARAEVALDSAMTEILLRERRNLFMITLRTILINARDKASKRRLKLSNQILWERVTMYFGGRAVLNAAGFIIGCSEGKDEGNGEIFLQQPLDYLESTLQRKGREQCIFFLPKNLNKDMINGALDAVESCLNKH